MAAIGSHRESLGTSLASQASVALKPYSSVLMMMRSPIFMQCPAEQSATKCNGQWTADDTRSIFQD